MDIDPCPPLHRFADKEERTATFSRVLTEMTQSPSSQATGSETAPPKEDGCTVWYSTTGGTHSQTTGSGLRTSDILTVNSLPWGPFFPLEDVRVRSWPPVVITEAVSKDVLGNKIAPS